MDKEELKKRTKDFALQVIEVVNKLPRSTVGKVIAYQLTKSATSTAANYRAACRARSRAEYLAKLQIVLEEADESLFWLETITESHQLPAEQVEPLRKEADELTAIFNSTLYKLRKN